MDRDLEAILQALDALKNATGEDAKRLRVIYNSHLEHVLERRPGLSRAGLQTAVLEAYRRWVKAQEKPSALPPLSRNLHRHSNSFPLALSRPASIILWCLIFD